MIKRDSHLHFILTVLAGVIVVLSAVVAVLVLGALLLKAPALLKVLFPAALFIWAVWWLQERA